MSTNESSFKTCQRVHVHADVLLALPYALGMQGYEYSVHSLTRGDTWGTGRRGGSTKSTLTVLETTLTPL